MRRAPSTETARRVVTVVAGDTEQRGLADICCCRVPALALDFRTASLLFLRHRRLPLLLSFKFLSLLRKLHLLLKLGLPHSLQLHLLLLGLNFLLLEFHLSSVVIQLALLPLLLELH